METNRVGTSAVSSGILASAKTYIASGLAVLFMAAAFTGIINPQTPPLRSEKPRVVYTLPRRKAQGDFNSQASLLEEAGAVAEHQAPDIGASVLNAEQSNVLLHPDLVTRMEKDATVRQYVQWTYEAAAHNGLDGHMLANQYWQESKFDAHAESSHGALGIAQIMQVHTGHLAGLNKRSDFLNARTSIDAGAELMGRLTHKYGDQSLALVAYNGGGRAVSFVEKNIGHKISIGDWMKFMANKRKAEGASNTDAWHVQTYHYVRQIDPAFWPKVLLARAEQTIKRVTEEAKQETAPAKAPHRTAQIGVFSLAA